MARGPCSGFLDFKGLRNAHIHWLLAEWIAPHRLLDVCKTGAIRTTPLSFVVAYLRSSVAVRS